MHVLRFRKLEFLACVDEGAAEHSLFGPFSNRFASWPRYISFQLLVFGEQICPAPKHSADSVHPFKSVRFTLLFATKSCYDRRRRLACHFMQSRSAYRRQVADVDSVSRINAQ